MTADTDRPEVGRALSALLQAVLAAEGARPGSAVDAFLLEYSDEIVTAAAEGPSRLAEVYLRGWNNALCAALALIDRAQSVHGDDPRAYLPAMIREERKADRA